MNVNNMSFPLLLPAAFITYPYILHAFMHFCVWNVIALLAVKLRKLYYESFLIFFITMLADVKGFVHYPGCPLLIEKVIIRSICDIVRQVSL